MLKQYESCDLSSLNELLGFEKKNILFKSLHYAKSVIFLHGEEDIQDILN